MIAARTVYDTCLALAKKDQRGRAFNIDEYNKVAALVNMELYNYYVGRYESGEALSIGLNQFKIRELELSLTSGVGSLPGRFARMAGNPTMDFPSASITATSSVTIVNNPDAKVKITSPNHGLKDGAVITCIGLSAHAITSEPIHFIDKNSFWVDVDYVGADVLTNARWEGDEQYRIPLDLVTEEELSVIRRDPNLKPTLFNPVYVFQWVRAQVEAYNIIALATNTDDPGFSGMAKIITTNEDTPFAAKPGDYIYFITGPAPYEGHGYTVVGLSEDSTAIFIDGYAATDLGDYLFLNFGEPTQVHVYPETISSIYVNYLRYPNVPFLDYYVDDLTYVITYLDERETLTNFAAGNTYRNGTVGDGVVDIHSRTVNWEWNDDMLPQIVYMMLQKMGINLENMTVAQIATQLQAKEETNI